MTSAVLALLTERDDLKNCREALILENQCTPRLAAEVDQLQKELADRKKTYAMAKTLTKSRSKNRASDALNWVTALEAELTEAKNAHLRLANASAGSRLILLRHNKTWKTLRRVEAKSRKRRYWRELPSMTVGSNLWIRPRPQRKRSFPVTIKVLSLCGAPVLMIPAQLPTLRIDDVTHKRFTNLDLPYLLS